MTNVLTAPNTKTLYLTREAKLHKRYDDIPLRDTITNVYAQKEIVHAGNYGSDEITLRSMLRSDEKIKAKVYGYSTMGFVLMAITSERLIMIYKKFLFEDIKEFTLDSVTGIRYDKHLILIDVTISTRVGDFNIWLFNTRSAMFFIREVEEQYMRASFLSGYTL